MKEQNSNSKQNCPSPEGLNLWHDGEGSPGDEFEEHLAQCEHCRQCLASYHQIDNGVRGFLSNSDELLADRIIKNCQRNRVIGDVFYHILRAAAVLLIILGVIGMFFQGEEQRTAETAEEPEPPVFRPASDIDFSNPEFFVLIKRDNQLEPLYGPWNRDGGRSSLPGFHQAGQAGVQDQLVSSGESPRLASPLAEVLPRNIRHVWVVDDLAGSREKLLEILPDGSRCSLQRNEDEDSIDFTIWLADENLQELVDRMAEEYGWALVSSDLPQPGEGGRLISKGRVIQYHCTITLGK